MNTCIKCGREIPDGELFCNDCALNPGASETVQKPAPALSGRMQKPVVHPPKPKPQQVLLRPKFHLTERIVGDLLDNIIARAVFADAHKLMLELPDPKDVVFYEVTMEQRKTEDTYLVTGNLKHFPSEHFVVTPRQMLDIIVNNEK